MIAHNLRFRALSVVVFLLLQLLPGALPAEIYKWTDADGRVHYGSSKPSDVESSTMQTPAPPPAAEVSRAERRLQEMLDRERDAEEPEPDPQAAEDARHERDARLAECKSARYALRVLQLERPLYRTDASGKRIYLEDDQRAREIAEARARVKASCR